MEKRKKVRLNLYISKELIDFAKEWSYVTGRPISRMLEDLLKQQRLMVRQTTPFQWLNDPKINPSLPQEDSYFIELDNYIQNKEEKEFCEQNPGHPRAKMRKALIKEREEHIRTKLEGQKEKEKQLIERWMEVFHAK